MLNWPGRPLSSDTTRRLLAPGFATVLVVAALAASSILAARPARGAGTSDDHAGSPTRWTSQPPLLRARVGLGVATVGGQILAIGGFDAGDPLVDVVEARRRTGIGTWRDLAAPMPTPRANHATAEVGGLVYAVSGFDRTNTVVNVVEVFHPRSGRWTNGVPLPRPRAAAGVAALGGLLYVAGGGVLLANGEDELANSMIVYDPRRRVWRSAAPMPTARDRHRLVASGGYLYAIGGRDERNQTLTTVERYDPRSDSWRTMNPMRESRYLPCVVETVVGNQRVVLAVGGIEHNADGEIVKVRRTSEVFNLHTGRWTLLDVLLPVGRVSHDCAVQPNGTVLAIGGGSPVGGTPRYLADVDALSLKPRDLR
ncbi:hypothetical protein FKR81_01895 [Lentzea tibetensis]|uniref:N-acetylneuraminic acid mutarotase n=1 Tax=Lentzea tibetensis TaxID=2591470 RepID=A0A563F329_9PSEU|nr:kelch repeat-containing protein [Lentzea tibetensis]TWP54329.1 hypothetical protein FKR81_01895 [Lentzea tibetensis]